MLVGLFYTFAQSKKNNIMQPIERFELAGVNYQKEEELLYYVDLFMEMYIPDISIVIDTYPELYNLPKKYTRTGISEEELRNVPISTEPQSLRIFVQRYNDGLLTKLFNYDEYIKNKDIQNLIKELGLKVDQFWFFILFIYDYSWSLCINGKAVRDSPKEQLENFVEAVRKNTISFDNYEGAVLEEDMKIILYKGKKKEVVIDDPTAIFYLMRSCFLKRKEEKIDKTFLMTNKTELNIPVNFSVSINIYCFANMFLTFFDTDKNIKDMRKKNTLHSKKEKELVSLLIYFTKLSNTQSWLDAESDTLKAFLHQYKYKDIKSTSNIYPSINC